MITNLSYLKAQCPLGLNVFPNPSFEEMSCCPQEVEDLSCLNDWNDAIEHWGPDYFHSCGYMGVEGFNSPPDGFPDGNGSIALHRADVNRIEYIQTCITSFLDTSLYYIFSGYTGYNYHNTIDPYPSPLAITLYGLKEACSTSNVIPTDCPALSNWDSLTEIVYTFPDSGKGWVSGHSLCFKPNVEYNQFIIGYSCWQAVTGYNFFDLLELRPCEPLLNVDVNIFASCGTGVDGSVDLTVSNGVPPYVFDWDIDGTGDFDDDEDQFDLAPGNYVVVVMDAMGLERCLNIYVPGTDVIDTDFDDIMPLCQGDPEIPLSTSSLNTPPVTGSWTPAVVQTATPGVSRYVFHPDTQYCADSFELFVLVKRAAVDTGHVYYTGCMGDGYQVFVNNTLYNESNPTGMEVLETATVCDSVVAIDLEFQANTAGTYADTACMASGYSVVINGTTYDESHPIGQETMINAAGCDSVVDVGLIYLSNNTGLHTYTGCTGDGYAIVINGTTYNETNPTGQEVFTSSNGCDSVLTVDLNYTYVPPLNITYSGCTGDGYAITINGTVYDEFNTQGVEIMSSVYGCDSIISVDLEFNSTIERTLSHSGCIGDGYTVVVNGTTYNESNPTGTELLPSSMGCDTTLMIDLSFAAQLTGEWQYIGCRGDGYSIVVNGTTYDESNPTGIDTLVSTLGCDSVVTIELEFNSEINMSETYSGCIGDGYSVTVNNVVYDESNSTGTETLVSSGGCDSVVTINLIFNSEINTLENYSGCIGDGYSVVVNGTTYDESNPTGTETLVSSGGCDSVVAIDLIFNSEINTLENYSGCIGDGYSVTVNNVVYDESNPTGSETLVSSGGCDSVITINLIFNSEINTLENYSGCIGDGYSITVNNVVYDESSPTGTETLVSSGGCDSVVTIDLVFNSEIHMSETYSGCVGDGYSVVVNGNTYDESNPTGIETLVSSGGCDSVVTIDLVFNSEIQTSESYAGCIGDGYSVVVNGTTYDESNPTGAETLISSGGCDSVITIDLEFNSEINISENYSGCIGDGYAVEVNGVVYDENNPAGEERMVSVSGCDSVVAIQLEYLETLYGDVTYHGCEGDDYQIEVNGTIYDAGHPAGEELLVSVSGCDSVVRVDLVFELVREFSRTYTTITGESIVLDISDETAAPDSIVAIDWQPETDLSCTDCPAPVFSGTSDMDYTVEVTDISGCEHRGYIRVEVGDITSASSVFVPDIFSPNNDGINDVFRPYSSANADIRVMSFEIYDRWGNRVFQRSELSIHREDLSWDGNVNGKTASPGVYVYVVSVLGADGFPQHHYGQVNLIR